MAAYIYIMHVCFEQVACYREHYWWQLMMLNLCEITSRAIGSWPLLWPIFSVLVIMNCKIAVLSTFRSSHYCFYSQDDLLQVMVEGEDPAVVQPVHHWFMIGKLFVWTLCECSIESLSTWSIFKKRTSSFLAVIKLRKGDGDDIGSITVMYWFWI